MRSRAPYTLSNQPRGQLDFFGFIVCKLTRPCFDTCYLMECHDDRIRFGELRFVSAKLQDGSLLLLSRQHLIAAKMSDTWPANADSRYES